MRQGRLITAFAVALSSFLPMVAKAQSTPYFGPSVGVFFPTQSNLRDAMGDAWFSFGASRVKIDPYSKQNIGWDWNAFSKDRSGSKVFMFAGTVGYTMPFAAPGASARPYFAVRGGLSYVDYAVNTSAVNRVSAKRVGFNANMELGINVGERFNISARYDLFPEYDGLNFSGFSLALKWGVARF